MIRSRVPRAAVRMLRMLLPLIQLMQRPIPLGEFGLSRIGRA